MVSTVVAWAHCNGFGPWRAMLLSPCITSVPDHMTTLCKSPFVKDRDVRGKMMPNIYRMGHFFLPYFKCTLLLRLFLGDIHKEYKYLHSLCSFGGVHSHTSTPDCCVISLQILFCPLIIQPDTSKCPLINIDPYF